MSRYQSSLQYRCRRSLGNGSRSNRTYSSTDCRHNTAGRCWSHHFQQPLLESKGKRGLRSGAKPDECVMDVVVLRTIHNVFIIKRPPHFFMFLFSTLFSLRTRLFLRRAGAPAPLGSAVFLRTRTRSFPFSGTRRELRAFFLARRRASRSGSTALAALRSALDKWTSCAPRLGLPFGIALGVGFVTGEWVGGVVDAEVVAAEGRPGALREPGKVLQRSTRNLRFANLSLPGSSASISSTHSRSYRPGYCQLRGTRE